MDKGWIEAYANRAKGAQGAANAVGSAEGAARMIASGH